tara:strand:- start:7970 stop:9736 length:1767 start_codon:yes stop_codon:yes gene_type:complete
MAQQTINIGSSANDGTGDPLRTAFDKINDNFSELYGASPFGQQITISGNKISSNTTNANLTLEASGTGAIELEGIQIRDNHIEGTRSNEDLIITPAGTGDVVLSALRINGTTIDSSDSSSVTIAEALDVTGALTGTTGSFSSTLGVTGATTLSSTLAVTGSSTLDGVTVTDNTISANRSNDDLILNGSGTGDVLISALRINGTTLDSSDSTAITIAEALDVTGALTGTTVNLSSTLEVTGASTLNGGATVSGSTTTTSLITNTITSNGSNADLTITGSGTGGVIVGAIRVEGTSLTADDSSVINVNEELNVDGALTVEGVTTLSTTNVVGNVGVQGVLTSTSLTTNDITSNGSNADINLEPQGTGAVVIGAAITHTGTQTTTGQLNVDNLRLDGNVLSATSGSITLTPASGQNLVLNTTGGGVTTSPEIQATLGEFITLRASKIENDISNNTLEIGAQGSGFVKIGQTEFSASASNIVGTVTNGDMTFTPNGTGDFRIDAHVGLKVQAGDSVDDADHAHIYAKDDSGSAEVFVRDEAGNVTKISPHNEKGNWEYYSRNINTGKVVRIDMEELIRDIETITGKQYINAQ